jgi:hypothetical protein
MKIIKQRPAVVGVYLPLAGGTMTGNIVIGANRLVGAPAGYIYEAADGDWRALSSGGADGRFTAETFLAYSRIFLWNDASGFDSGYGDGQYANFRSRDTGVGPVEIARMQGAADPYFQATLPMRLLPVATASLPATPVEGMIGYDATLKRLVHRDENGWRENAPTISVRKTANETVNNSAVLQDDDHLLLPLAANEVWEFEIILRLAIKAASDFQYTLTVPAGASGGFSDLTRLAVVASAIENAFAAAVSYSVAADQQNIVVIKGIVINGANAGNLQLRWAQLGAVAENTIVLANSCMIAHRLA